jgi:ABC-type sugar transport system substrate-binding protein
MCKKTLEEKEVKIPVIGTDGISELVEAIKARKMNVSKV